MPSVKSQSKVGIRPGTRDKLIHIADLRHWSHADTVDLALDALAQREGLAPLKTNGETPTDTRRKGRRAA